MNLKTIQNSKYIGEFKVTYKKINPYNYTITCNFILVDSVYMSNKKIWEFLRFETKYNLLSIDWLKRLFSMVKKSSRFRDTKGTFVDIYVVLIYEMPDKSFWEIDLIKDVYPFINSNSKISILETSPKNDPKITPNGFNNRTNFVPKGAKVRRFRFTFLFFD